MYYILVLITRMNVLGNIYVVQLNGILSYLPIKLLSGLFRDAINWNGSPFLHTKINLIQHVCMQTELH